MSADLRGRAPQSAQRQRAVYLMGVSAVLCAHVLRIYFNFKMQEINTSMIKPNSLMILNADQRDVYDSINNAIEKKEFGNKLYIFLDQSPGIGISFLVNTILARHRLQGKIVLAVTSCISDLAQMPGIERARSMFGIPHNCTETSLSSVGKIGPKADMLRQVTAIIWKDVLISSQHAINCVDKLFQELMSNDEPFGGKIMIFLGESMQMLGPTYINWWSMVKIIQLHTNVHNECKRQNESNN